MSSSFDLNLESPSSSQESHSALIRSPAKNSSVIDFDDVTVPEATEGADARAGLRQAVGQGIAQDMTSAFTSAIEAQKGISLNQSAVNAVLSQFN